MLSAKSFTHIVQDPTEIWTERLEPSSENANIRAVSYNKVATTCQRHTNTTPVEFCDVKRDVTITEK